MRRFLLTSLMFGLLSWQLHAQEAPTLAPSELKPLHSLSIADFIGSGLNAGVATSTAGAPQLMPVFRSPDGRLLALVALSTPSSGPLRPASPLIGAPSDWRLVDITGAVSGNLGLRLGETYNYGVSAGFAERALSQPTAEASLAVSCLPGSSSALGLPCWASAVTSASAVTPAAQYAAALGAGWSNNTSFALDISYNMTWLNAASGSPTRSALPASDMFTPVTENTLDNSLPSLILSGAGAYASGLGAGVAAHARWWPSIDDNFDNIDIGASMSRLQLNALGFNPALNFNQAALSLGLNHGALSGVVIGRVVAPGDSAIPGQHFSAIDLGVSWRTPWQGQLSIGTQNLFSSGAPPLAPVARDSDAAQARMPYVQYHQDL